MKTWILSRAAYSLFCFLIFFQPAFAEENKVSAKTGVSLRAVYKSLKKAPDVDRWEIFLASDPRRTISNRVAQSYQSRPFIELPPGSYIARVKKDKVRKEKLFEVKEKKVTELILEVPMQGRLRLTAVYSDKKDRAIFVKKWTVYQQAENQSQKRRIDYSYKKEPIFDLLPGIYLVEVNQDGNLQSREVEVKANKLRHLKMVLIKNQKRK